jgi:integrase
LHYDAFNFKNKFVSFLITKSGTPRSVPMSGAMHEIILRRARENSFFSQFVFPSPVKKNRPNSVGWTWKTALRIVKFKDFRWHDMRHTCCSDLAMTGEGLFKIGRHVGHKNPASNIR